MQSAPSVLSEKSSRALLGTRLARTPKYVLVIHGGAGTLDRATSTPEQRTAYTQALQASLRAGYVVLSAGGEAMDAAVAAVSSMEDNALFNSAHGAVFNVEGKNELEASIMLSRAPASHAHAVPHSRRGFSASLLTHARNPSQLVRALYLAPAVAPHAFLSGQTAERIGADLGATLVDESYFFTEKRWKEHRRGLGLPEQPLPSLASPTRRDGDALDQLPQGTVGAVALDIHGCIAAVTSTGGKTNKLAGRVGDTPCFGSGFWAEEWRARGWLRKKWCKLTKRACGVGVSGTGDGDYFIRLNTAASLAHLMRFQGASIVKASKRVVEDLRENGGLGGLIAVDTSGRVAMPMNCSGMYRGVIRMDGVALTAIFDDDELTTL